MATPLKVQIIVDDNGSVKVRQFGQEAERAGEKGERSFRRTGRSMDEMNQRAARAHSNILKIAGAVTALAGAAYGLKKLVDAASDLEEVTSKFNVVFEGQTAKAEKWAKVLVESYAMSTREARQYLSSVQDLLVPMGMQAQAAASLSNEIVKLSADLGSFNNLPTAQVMDDIQSALVGNYETMKKYGVVLNATIVQERALAMGLAGTKDQLTAAHKAQAAYALMVEGSTAAIGDMARTSESYANQEKKLLANLENLQAMLGEKLIPKATEIVAKTNEWIDANQELIDQKVDVAIDAIGTSIGKIVDIYNGLPDGVVGAAGVGIIGRLFLGAKAGGTIGLLYLVNEQLEALGWNLTETVNQAMNQLKSPAFKGGEAGDLSGAGGSFETLAQQVKSVTDALEDEAEAINKAYKATVGLNETTEDTAKKVQALAKALKEDEKATNDAYQAHLRYQETLRRYPLSSDWMLDQWVWNSQHAIAQWEIQADAYGEIMAEMEADTDDATDEIANQYRDLYESSKNLFSTTVFGDAQNQSINNLMKSLEELSQMYDELPILLKQIEVAQQALIDQDFSTIIDSITNAGDAFKDLNLDDFFKDDKLLEDVSFDSFVDAFKDAYDEMSDVEKAHHKDTLDLILKGQKARNDSIAYIQKAQLQSLSAQAAAWGQMFGAVKNMYAEGTQEYQQFAKMEEAARLAQIVLSAVQAIVNAGASGDPYTAIARMAAMAAAVAAVLGQIGLSVSGPSGSMPEGETPEPASTVLGAEAGVGSESLSKSVELLEDIYNVLDYGLTNLYDELRELNKNLTGLVKSIITTGGLPEFAIDESSFGSVRQFIADFGNYISMIIDPLAGLFNKVLLPFVDLITNIVGWLWNGLFGGDVTQEIVEFGIHFGDVLISDVLKGLEISASAYARIKKTEEGGWFGSDDVSYYYKYADLDQEVIDMLTKVFVNIGNSLLILAEKLGVNAQKVYDYVFEAGKLNLQGMSTEEMSQALSEYFSNIADVAARDLFGDILKKYQKVGEGMFETAVRIVMEMEYVQKTLDMTGQSFKAVGDYTESATEKFIAFSQALIDLAGGLDELNEAVETYFQKFLTKSEQTAFLETQLTGALGNQDVELPGTRQAFKDLVAGLDLTTESGQKLYVLLLQLAGAADQYYSAIEDAEADIKSFNDNLNDIIGYTSSLEKTIRKMADDWEDVQESLAIKGITDETEKIAELNKELAKARQQEAAEISKITNLIDAISSGNLDPVAAFFEDLLKKSNKLASYKEGISESMDSLSEAIDYYESFDEFHAPIIESITNVEGAAKDLSLALDTLFTSLSDGLTAGNLDDVNTYLADAIRFTNDYIAELTDAISWMKSGAYQGEAASGASIIAYFEAQKTYAGTMKKLLEDFQADLEDLAGVSDSEDAIARIKKILDDLGKGDPEEALKYLQDELEALKNGGSSTAAEIAALEAQIRQLEEATAQYIAMQEKQLYAMKVQMGLITEEEAQAKRLAEIKDRYKEFGLSFEQMIDWFKNAELSDLKAIADHLDMDWKDIASDIAFLIDAIDYLGDSAGAAGSAFQQAAEQIRQNLDDLRGEIYGTSTGSSAASIAGKINDIIGMEFEKLDMDKLLHATELMKDWWGKVQEEARDAMNAERDRLQGQIEGLNKEAENLRLQQQVADRLESLLDSIDNAMRNIKYSKYNLTLPSPKADEAKQELAQLFQAAMSGGTAEIQEFLGFAPKALEQYQAAYKSSEKYQQFYETVMGEGGWMEQIKAYAQTGSFEEKLLAEVKNTNEELQAIEEQIENLRDQLGDLDIDMFISAGDKAQFEAWASAIENLIAQMEATHLILTVDWTNYDGDIKDVLQMLMDLVETYGWENDIVLSWVSDMTEWLATQPIDDIIDVMDQIAERAPGGWDSEVMLAFISDLGRWLVNDIEKAKAVLDYLVKTFGAGAWEKDVVLTYITRLLENGISWGAMRDALSTYYGLPDDQIKKILTTIFQDQTGEGWTWDEFMNAWTVIGMEDSWATKYLEAIYNDSGATGLKYWADFVLAFNLGGLPDATAQKILTAVYTAVDGEPGIALWADFKAAMQDANIGKDSTAWKTIEAAYNDSAGAFPNWSDLEIAMDAAGVSKTAKKTIEGAYTSGDMTWTELENMLAETGTPETVIRDIKATVSTTAELTVSDWLQNIFISMDTHLSAITRQLWIFSDYWLNANVASRNIPRAYLDVGGILEGPSSGYMLPDVMFHGREAVIPLESGDVLKAPVVIPPPIINGGSTQTGSRNEEIALLRELVDLQKEEIDTLRAKDTNPRVSVNVDAQGIVREAGRYVSEKSRRGTLDVRAVS